MNFLNYEELIIAFVLIKLKFNGLSYGDNNGCFSFYYLKSCFLFKNNKIQPFV